MWRMPGLLVRWLCMKACFACGVQVAFWPSSPMHMASQATSVHASGCVHRGQGRQE